MTIHPKFPQITLIQAPILPSTQILYQPYNLSTSGQPTLPFPPPLPQILCCSGHFVLIHKGHSETSLPQRVPSSSCLPVAYMGSALASHSFPSINSSPATPPLLLLLQTCPAPSSPSACVTAHSPFPLPQKFHLVFPSQHLLFEALSQFCSAQPPSEQSSPLSMVSL